VFSIIIFGGSRGIGKVIAEYYIGKKFEVSVGGRNVKALDKFRLAMTRKKLGVNVIRVDITNGRDVARAFKAHVAKWGRSPNVVINCAAIQGPIGNSWSVSARKWEETIKVNLFGSFVVARAAIRQMIKNGYGSVILFSGGGAAYARPNLSAYAASKTGILRMVETMAEELKLAGYPNIIINAVAPGAVKTRMTREVLKAGSKAGEKALEEAAEVSRTGGTPSKQITNLIDFLIDLEANRGLSGRLIHVHEDYQWLIEEFGAKVPDDIGKIRRIPIQPER
jgi:NAD(P)-dependent dehydrogenase (short-subunit alcohol dehydrogenase family)